MKKIDIFFTGGGTAGHVLPNIFLINELVARNPDLRIAYIGSKNSMEKKLFLEHFPEKEFFGIHSDKLRRYLTLKHIIAPFKIFYGFLEAFLILKKERPKLIFAKGGFVCVPVIFAAYLLKIKIFIHESDYSIGLANKISMPLASLIGVSFQKTIENNTKFLEKMKLFGPIFNKKILNSEPCIDQENSMFKKINFWENEEVKKPILLIIGGSLGSKIINDLIYQNYEKLLKKFNLIHICGAQNLNEEISKKSLETGEFNYILSEIIPHEILIFLIKKADVVVSRAGINSVFELMFFEKLSIFIPLSKKNSRGDQIENANYFFQKNACEVIFEEDLNFEILLSKLCKFLEIETRQIYEENLKKLNIKLGTDEIVNEIQQILKKETSTSGT